MNKYTSWFAANGILAIGIARSLIYNGDRGDNSSPNTHIFALCASEWEEKS